MVDSRTQAYKNLIQELLPYSSLVDYSSQVNQILNADQELIDKGFVEEMRRVAGWFTQQGHEKVSEFYKDIANQLAKFISDTTAPTHQDYLNFLLEVWETAKNNNFDHKVIFDLIKNNQDKLDDNFRQVFEDWASAELGKNEQKNYDIAHFLLHFSTIIRQRKLGKQEINIEIAITGYEIAHIIWNKKKFFQEWALVQNNRAVAYTNRKRDSREHNMEKAISCCKSILESCFIETLNPQLRIDILNNLGNAYSKRIRWTNQNNFLEAIKCYESALEICPKEEFSFQWATLQYSLALAYSNKIGGGKMAEKIQQLIKHCHFALEVFTPEAFPNKWASCQCLLGDAYLAIGDTKLAISYYQDAREILQDKECAEDWAITCLKLAYAFRELIRKGSSHKELYGKLAAARYQNALQVFTFEEYPDDWASVQNSLGDFFREQGQLEEAKKYFVAALTVYHKSDEFPQELALTLNRIAQIDSIQVGITKAIEWIQLGLKICNPISFPTECLILGMNLGFMGLKSKQWKVAIQGYEKAIAAVEQSREWATNEAARQEIQLNAIDVYIKMVQACINDGQIEKALETVERSKSRNLVELLVNSELEPKGADDQLKQDLRRLRSTISSIRQLLADSDNNSTFNRDSFQGLRSSETSSYNREYIAQQRELLQEYQHQLDEVFAQCQQLDPAFTLTQEVKSITVAEIRDLIDSHTAILEWYIGTDSFQIFIVTQSSLEVEQFDKTELEKLEAWNQQYLEALFNDTETWQDNLSEWLNSLSQILRFDEILNHPALANCDSLILVPHRYLHLFPLHALSVSQQTWLRFNPETPHLQPPTNPCLLDCFKKGVRYAPSCQLLQRVQQRERPPAATRTLFAIQNPTEDLDYTDIEVETIKRDFSPADILSKQQATKTALLDNLETIAQAHYVHFSCHGSFDFQTPLISSLILAGAMESTDSPTPTGQKSLRLRSGGQANPAKCLTLQDIFATLNLPKCRLVTLSACETGLTDTTKQSDDCIGLATGFLYAGSQGVLSSLWSVNDFATAYLMIKCYENLETSDMAVALNTAQLWLRDATQSKLLEWIGKLKLDLESTQHIKGFLESYDSDETPFESPVFWAAFCAIGK
ncbi:CHAT domain-containing protein [Planktothrix rubescens]|uniref:CHAT domain-containing protein n=1 Tax=Planktothrix rubescens TaxID=59512 RepID=UPI0003FEEBA5|nr:CHAT domain-containing tetratricopeptide repeat protein [Planktothrix rubescens]